METIKTKARAQRTVSLLDYAQSSYYFPKVTSYKSNYVISNGVLTRYERQDYDLMDRN